VESNEALREFLRSRRARITPESAGLRAFGGRRRGAGLRREEVADLADISVEYYTRLERGNANGVSIGVLDSVARALQLDPTERARLAELTRGAATDRPLRRRPNANQIKPSTQRVLDAVTTAVAYVRNRSLDIIACNRLAAAVYVDLYDDPMRPISPVRYVFLDERAKTFYPDWELAARNAIGLVRMAATRDPYDRDVLELIDELNECSEQFRALWVLPDVKFRPTGVTEYRHPRVGLLTLTYDAFTMVADASQTLVVLSAEPESRSGRSLALLAGSTEDQPLARIASI
jgi:transcriptional regulator with XRE-family HTH domain